MYREESVRYDHPVVGESVPECNAMFAVVGLGGKQHKVTSGDILMTAKLKGIDVGTTLDVKSVLLVGGRDFTMIGKPHIAEAVVKATVQEQTQTAKTMVFKMKKRKRYKKRYGHRTEVTILKIDSIQVGERRYDAPAGHSPTYHFDEEVEQLEVDEQEETEDEFVVDQR